jgi:hypothetical protein
MVAVRFGQACVVRGLVGRYKNMPHRRKTVGRVRRSRNAPGMLGGMRNMVAVRFGQACVVRGLVGGGDQNTPYRFKNAPYNSKQFDSRTHPTTLSALTLVLSFDREVETF